MKKLSLFFMITLLPVLGNAQTLIDGIYYNLNPSDNTASVTNNSNSYYSGRIVIPEQVFYEGVSYTVTSIGDNAFNNCTNLTNVSISNRVTSIGKGAFGKTSLRTLIVGTGVQLFDSQAFSGATQPIKTIWFTNTPPQNYSVAQGIVNYVANSQYGSLNNRIEYKYLSSLFNVDGVTYVPVSPSERTCDAIDCIYDESTSLVNIDETVSYQGINMKVLNVQPYTFYQNSSLLKINLDIEGSIGKHAFDGCANLQTVELSNIISIIDEYAFNECSKLESIIVPNSVKEIHQYAFYGCSNMMSVTIGDGTKTIGKYAFCGCSNMNSAIIGSNTRLILGNAFEGCSSLSSISIPGSVHYIDDYTFSGCNSLKDLFINECRENIVTSFFDDMDVSHSNSTTTLLEIYVSTGDELSFNYTLSNYGALYVNTPRGSSIISTKNKTRSEKFSWTATTGGLLSISFKSPSWSQSSCSIKDIKLIESNTLSLGSNVSPLFADCPLNSVYIDRRIAYFKSPFYNNTSLRSVTITDHETEIMSNEFNGCTNLENVEIGNSVKKIGDWAFSGCSKLNIFTFGNSVESIGKEAFSDCTALTQLISHSTTPPTCGSQALDDINKWTCKLFVPKGCVNVYQTADQWKEFFFIEEGEKPKAGIAINEENFPDANFRAYLMSQSYGNDGIITENEIKNVASIDVSRRNITNLKGIEYFTALTDLNCSWNQLTSLDVSKNTALTKLDCSSNQLTNLDVSKNTALTVLGCERNQLTSLDVSKNTDLTGLWCRYNQLTSLDVSKNTALTGLYCSSNQLTNLDVSKNTTLTSLVCCNNKIKGEAMDALVGSLPNCESAVIYIIDLSNSSEENVCTSIQVNIAKEKGWRVVTSSGEDYEGSDQILDEDISGSCGDDVNYTYKKANHILTISGSGAIFDYGYDSNKAPWSSYADEIQKIEIESGITSIGYFAFYKCSGITSLSIPATVGFIGSSAFEDCTSLTSLVLNEGLLSIGGSAFESCIGLKALTIPSTVNSISINAFKNCKGITDVYCYAEIVPDTHFDAFDATPTEKSTLHVPANSVEAYRASWPWSDFKAIVPLGSSGDTNGDGVVDDKDIYAIVEYLMNGKADGFNLKNADASGDQKVNVADIVRIINRIKK